MAVNHGLEKAIVRDAIIDLLTTIAFLAMGIYVTVYYFSTEQISWGIFFLIGAVIFLIVGIVQIKDLVLAIKNLRKKQKEWQNYGK